MNDEIERKKPSNAVNIYDVDIILMQIRIMSLGVDYRHY